jgi:hypothetical protein
MAGMLRSTCCLWLAVYGWLFMAGLRKNAINILRRSV